MKDKRSEIEHRTSSLYNLIHNTVADELREAGGRIYDLKAQRIPIDALAGGVIAELGCGALGRNLNNFSGPGPKLFALVDLSPENVRDTRQIAEGLNIPHCSFAVGDVTQPPFGDATFDFVNCDGVLHCTLDPDQGLREIVRILKPGGVANLGIYGRGGMVIALLNLIRAVTTRLPIQMIHGALRLVLRDKVLIARIMDNLCAPIRECYRMEEFQKKISDLAAVEILESFYEQWTIGFPRFARALLTGKEYMKFVIKKQGGSR